MTEASECDSITQLAQRLGGVCLSLFLCSLLTEMASLADFKHCLKFLKASRSSISSLARKADALVIHAPQVVDAIIEYMDKVIQQYCVVFKYLFLTINIRF